VDTPATVQSLNVAVASDGTVGLLYYDLRNNHDGNHLITDAWLVRSSDHGVSFDESHVGGPFDLAATPPGARGVGEYQGLRGLPGGFAVAYTLGNPSGVGDQPVMGVVQPSSLVNANPTDILFSRFAD
jgi:hypothetical protein